MGKEDLIRTINTFFNPLEYTNVHRIPGQGPAAQVATRGASLALGMGAAAALARTLTRTNDVKERQEKLRSWAGSRFPVISADTNVDDLEEERKLQGAGVQKLGAEGSAIGNWLGSLVTGKHDTLEPAVNIAATMGGLYGGYKLSDYIADTRRKTEMGEDIEGKRNEIDKLIYDEYMRTRGLEKAADLNMATSADLSKPDGALRSTMNDPVGSASRLGKTIFTAYGMATLALAYKYSKDYHDKEDPARARVKQLEHTAKRRAMQTQAPLFLEAGNLPDIGAGAKRIAPAAPKAPMRVSTTPGGRSADPTDPLSSILNS